MRRRSTSVGTDEAASGTLDLCELSRKKEVWERIVSHLDAPVARSLGATCRTMYEGLLCLPWSRFVDDEGQAVYAPVLRHDDQNAYADHCHALLLRLHGLYDKRGRLPKKRLGYTIECRGLQRQQSVAAEGRMVPVHQTMYFFNQAQIARKVRCAVLLPPSPLSPAYAQDRGASAHIAGTHAQVDELKTELEKVGREVMEGPSTQVEDAAAAPQKRRAPKRKAAAAAAAPSPVRPEVLDMVAADMSVKQLQQALKHYNVPVTASAKKAALVKMLDKARNDSAAGAGGAAAGGLAAMAASAGGKAGRRGRASTGGAAPAPRQPTRKQRASAPAAAAAAVGTGKRGKKRPRGGAAAAAAVAAAAADGDEPEGGEADDKEEQEDEVEEEGDPVAMAEAMAAQAISQLAYNELMKACIVRGLDEWGSKEEL
jgi:hypothetical protein